MKTIIELREEFENMAKSCMFDIDRLPSGEYKSSGRNTFIFWAGYWECAKINGIIDSESDALKMNELEVKLDEEIENIKNITDDLKTARKVRDEILRERFDI